jgi:predicted transcriptional regulator
MLPLAPTEWFIMYCIWDLGPSEAKEVSEQLVSYDRNFSPKTTSIFLARLVEKGYLSFRLGTVERSGRRPHVYFPVVTYEAAMRRMVEKILDEYQLDPEEFNDAWVAFMEERKATRVSDRRKMAIKKVLGHSLTSK